MGGVGSGRPPSAATIAQRMNPPMVTPIGNQIILPDYSGVKSEALKTSSTDIKSNWTESGTNIYNSNSGNVGIGTTAPSKRLHIYNSGGNDGIRIESVRPQFELKTTSATSTWRNWGLYTNWVSAGDLNLYVSSTVGGDPANPVLSALSDGKVGIGTTSPSQKLHVSGNAYVTGGFGVGSQAGTTAGGITIDRSGADPFMLWYESGSIIGQLRADITDGNFYISDGSGTLKYFSVGTVGTYAGRVGIGTTNPTAVLHLKAGTATASTAPFKFTSGTNLTTAEAGAVEYDGKTLYFSPLTTRRAVSLSSGSITSSTTVTNTATETTIYTNTIDANSFSVGKVLRALSRGYYSVANGADTFTLRFKIGGSTVATATSSTGVATNAPWHSNYLATIRTIGAGGTISSFVDLDLNDGSKDAYTESSAIDTTTSNTLTITLQWSAANAGHIFTITQSVLEFLDG